MCKCDEHQSCQHCHTISLVDGWLAEEISGVKRWSAVAHYRTTTGNVSFTHTFEEISELAAIVEAGPDWATLDRIEIRYNLE